MPRELFASKFNSKTNNDAITRLISLVKTKKTLFDRSLITRNKKLDEMEEEKNYTTPMSHHLQAKMMAMQSEKLRQYDNMSTNRHKIKRMKSKEKKEEEVPVPEYILHKMKNLEEMPLNLPKLKDKVVFFP